MIVVRLEGQSEVRQKGRFEVRHEGRSEMRTLTTGYEDSPLGLSPKKIGEDIAKETAKDWKCL